MQKEYYEQGEEITLSDGTIVTIEIRQKEVYNIKTKRPEPICDGCYYDKTMDCSDRLCSFDERGDRKDIIFKAHE